ncbi:MAG: hypothetical protein U0670_17610 [Anaerolineae bacterium]
MYLRTPKRYRPGYRERRLLNLRWLWLWIVTPIAVYVGINVYNDRSRLAPPVQHVIEQAIQNVQGGVATMSAPTPMPTENPANRLSRADESWTTGAIGRAIEDYQSAAPSTPNIALVFTRIALGYVIEGNNAAAIDASADAVTADPYDPDAWSVRALALARNDEPSQGIAAALQALSLRQGDPQALAFLAEAYRLDDRISLAQETADRAIDADPNRYEGYYVRGLINYYNVGDFTAAREDFATASDLAPNMPHIAVERATVEWQFDNTDVSMDILSNVVELDPENLDALYSLGYFYYQTYGDSDQSLEYLGRCLAASPEYIPCLSYQAVVQANIGRITDAMDTYRTLMSTGTANPRYYLRAGALFADSGDCATALPWLRRGYELEQRADEPSVDRLATFESYLNDCQPGSVIISPEATAEAPQ